MDSLSIGVVCLHFSPIYIHNRWTSVMIMHKTSFSALIYACHLKRWSIKEHHALMCTYFTPKVRTVFTTRIWSHFPHSYHFIIIIIFVKTLLHSTESVFPFLSLTRLAQSHSASLHGYRSHPLSLFALIRPCPLSTKSDDLCERVYLEHNQDREVDLVGDFFLI